MKQQLQEIYTILRDSKWIVAVCLVISAILYLPEQVRELFRISATEGGSIALTQFVALILIALVIWVGAIQVTAETLAARGPFTKLSFGILQFLPVVLACLPLLAATIAQMYAKPGEEGLTTENVVRLNEVGSIFRVQKRELEIDAGWLEIYFWIFLIATVAVGIGTWWFGDKLRQPCGRANTHYFKKSAFLLATVALIAAIAAAFVLVPVTLPQILGPFGILAIFTLCVVAFCIHVSLLTIKHCVPYLPILFLWALLLSAWNLNDNHLIRTAAESSDKRAATPSPPTERIAAEDAFVKWLRQRSRQVGPTDSGTAGQREYPVFIVAAQGGGIYAAQNAAIFLARIQDLCPSFRHHLFAISSVSGGSVGAATFAAALHAADQEAGATPRPDRERLEGPCPEIGKFLSGAYAVSEPDKVGSVESKVHLALSSDSDFLSPLVAAALFPNFTQAFIPRPIGWFDRARALEYALEDAADKMYPPPPAGGHTANLMKRSYQDHWSSEGSIPALLMNATGSGSGKRVVISPFDLDSSNPVDWDVCVMANVPDLRATESIARRPNPSTSLDFPLSTAAFIGARFPWVTPAATVRIKNPCITKKDTVRLVDGGYVDNSGVETALNLIDQIKAAADDARTSDPNLPKPRIYLVSLTGGDFPDRGAFSYNEFIEPIRALLSGRESRAYIALNRAALQMKGSSKSDPASPTPPLFNKADLKNYFYSLPLGWAISDKTREIIGLSSGRYWDCEPGSGFSQRRKHLGNADCIYLQIYHLLNNSAASAMEDQAVGQKIEALLAEKLSNEKKANPRLDHEKLLVCYESWWQARSRSLWEARRRQWEKDTNPSKSAKFPDYKESYLAYYQSEHVRELLREWDRRPDFNENVLAYLLGSGSYDSSDFRRTTDNLSFTSEPQIKSYWPARIAKINEHRKNEDPNASDVDLSQVINNPKALANLVWGWPGNDLGNNPKNPDGTYDPNKKDDGWLYRPRGVYQIIGRWQYDRYSGWLDPGLGINLLNTPDAASNRVISAKIVFEHFRRWRYATGISATGSSARRTLVEILGENPGNWELARSYQVDKGKEAPKQVAERSAMFERCISEAQLSTQASR